MLQGNKEARLIPIRGEQALTDLTSRLLSISRLAIRAG